MDGDFGYFTRDIQGRIQHWGLHRLQVLRSFVNNDSSRYLCFGDIHNTGEAQLLAERPIREFIHF
jgi:hypothetical protein